MSTRLGFKDIGIRKSGFLAKTRINKRRLFMTAVSSNLNFKKRETCPIHSGTLKNYI